MQVNALIDHGQVKLLEPINLKHDQVNIQLIIPDSEIIKTSITVNNNEEKAKDIPDEYAEFPPQIQKMMHNIDKILNAHIDDSDIHKLTKKQQQRFEEFSYRQEFKNE
jgi:hypothetical protein